MRLHGGPELVARLEAIKASFRPMGRNWADETARLARDRVPVRTGRLQRSIRRTLATERKAEVRAHFTAFFVDAGVKPHTIEPKKFSGSKRGGVGRSRALMFQAGGRTVFTRKTHHPGYRARRFRAKSAREALKKTVGLEQIIRAWNAAGGVTRLDVRAGRGVRLRPRAGT